MNDRIYFTIAFVIAAAVLGDIVLNSGEASVFVARKFLGLVQAMVFWRH